MHGDLERVLIGLRCIGSMNAGSVRFRTSWRLIGFARMQFVCTFFLKTVLFGAFPANPVFGVWLDYLN
jgi:hypothetical protein